MRITIDTKEDSKEEIRKLIQMLSNIIENKEVYVNRGNIFSDSKEETARVESAFGDMFGNNQAEAQEETREVGKEKTKEKIEIPRIIEY